jgi:hypothetical protein
MGAAFVAEVAGGRSWGPVYIGPMVIGGPTVPSRRSVRIHGVKITNLRPDRKLSIDARLYYRMIGGQEFVQTERGSKDGMRTEGPPYPNMPPRPTLLVCPISVPPEEAVWGDIAFIVVNPSEEPLDRIGGRIELVDGISGESAALPPVGEARSARPRVAAKKGRWHRGQ